MTGERQAGPLSDEDLIDRSSGHACVWKGGLFSLLQSPGQAGYFRVCPGPAKVCIKVCAASMHRSQSFNRDVFILESAELMRNTGICKTQPK